MGTSRSQALLPGFLFCFWLTQRPHTSSKCPFSRGRVRQVRCHTGSFALSELDTMKIRSLQCLVSSKTPTPMQIPPCHHVLWMLRALGWLPQLSALDSPLKLTASLDEFSLQAMGKYKQKRGRLSDLGSSSFSHLSSIRSQSSFMWGFPFSCENVHYFSLEAECEASAPKHQPQP